MPWHMTQCAYALGSTSNTSINSNDSKCANSGFNNEDGGPPCQHISSFSNKVQRPLHATAQATEGDRNLASRTTSTVHMVLLRTQNVRQDCNSRSPDDIVTSAVLGYGMRPWVPEGLSYHMEAITASRECWITTLEFRKAVYFRGCSWTE